MNIDWEDIKARHLIEDVLQRRGVKVARGASGFVAKCPLHNEQKGEAFSIDAKKQLWRCFGKCQAGGDVINLIMQWDGVDAVTAAEILEGRKFSDDPTLPRVARAPRAAAAVEVPEVYAVRELPHIPKMYKGEERHWDLLARLRKLPHHGGVALAVQSGVLRYCLAYEQPAWAVLDVAEPCNVQVSRLDGEKWFGGQRKVMGVKFNWGKWPVGLTVALRHPQAEILLVEGRGDFVAAYHAACDGETAGIPVAMFGAGNPIHESALCLLHGRRVRIIEQHDEAGAAASRLWCGQLQEAGCRVVVRQVPMPGEDLNDHLSEGRGSLGALFD